MHPQWYRSVGIDPDSHWALVRPTFRTAMIRQPEVEVDVVLGRMVTLFDGTGPQQIVWPPPTDYVVAVEGKCAPVRWEDTEPWARATQPKSNLRDQLKRDLTLGFSRVAALHIIATPPSDNYWDVLRTAHQLGMHFLPIAERQIATLVNELPIGHAVLSMAGVRWKDEGLSGTIAPMKITPAPLVGHGLVQQVREQIDGYLNACQKPVTARAVFVREGCTWQPLTHR
jgi:hypothetical protein